MRKGEIACYKQFLLFSQCFPQLYIFSASKCGIVWQSVKHDTDVCSIEKKPYKALCFDDLPKICTH